MSESVERGATPEPSEPVVPQATIETVEQLVRTRLAEAFGGKRGIAESAVPTIAFTVLYVATQNLRLSLISSIGITVALLLVRLIQRSNPQFILNALVGIGIAALFASRSGEARDAFLPGILYNGGYAAVLVFSILIGWPIIGFMVGAVVGDLTTWREDKGMRKLCANLTWVFASACIIRVVVQYPLWQADQIALLGTAKVVMGWPLQIATLALMVWLLSRNATPLDEPITESRDLA